MVNYWSSHFNCQIVLRHVVLFVLMLSHGQISHGQEVGTPIVIGQKYMVTSTILNEERPINIYLPDDYSEEKSYPVMYLLDGDGNFHHTTACVRFLSKNKQIPQMIVVGIPNTDDRTRDLTPPSKSGESRYGKGGGSENMLDFIDKELIPYIERRYRTSPYKMLVGHSFGGLFAINTLLHRPGLFDSYIAISPSLWWDEQRLVIEQSDTFFETQKELVGHLYMTMGNEGGSMLGGAWKLAARLKEKGPKNFLWTFDLMEEETHGSIPHRSTYKGLEFIFKDWNLQAQQTILAAGGIQAINNYEKNVSLRYGTEIQWEEKSLIRLARQTSERASKSQAIHVLEKCVHLFPDSDNAWYQYGKMQMEDGRHQDAIGSLRKAIKINPDNLQALGNLHQLGVDISDLLPTPQSPKEALDTYVGKYQLDQDLTIAISLEGNQLIAQGLELENETLFPLVNNSFFVTSKNAIITFVAQADQQMRILIVTTEGELRGIRIEPKN